ncbi:MurR/RpiR family transcriptional regulator [Rhodoferax koreense]|uniref:MurR/RpiR family transcriptional regulator n=1 Tax=Rhodoferax koreensis TaxID=1842727 RepID=UPI001EF6EA95|nr:MurR/RpiR family transcriptional regulator [Rhodoferax koreense]
MLDLIAKAHPRLTPAHRKMADHVLHNPFRAATLMIEEFADEVGVSVATANRFARALGFDGYPQFRAELAKGYESTLAPVERMRQELQRPSSCLSTMATTLEEDEHNLAATRQSLSAAVCDSAVDAILQARRVLVLGFGASAYLAGLLQHGLDPYCATVQVLALAGGPTHAARQLSRAQAGDLVIAIAFPRYLDDTVRLSALACAQGAQLLAITDAATSPLVPLAGVVLYVRANRQFAATSNASALAMIEALCAAVAYRASDALGAAQQLTQSVMPWLYLEPTAAGKTRAAGPAKN